MMTNFLFVQGCFTALFSHTHGGFTAPFSHTLSCFTVLFSHTRGPAYLTLTDIPLVSHPQTLTVPSTYKAASCSVPAQLLPIDFPNMGESKKYITEDVIILVTIKPHNHFKVVMQKKGLDL